MSKNSVDTYSARGKTNLLLFDPESLHLVTNPASPLYDERVNLPIKEAMVLNIMHHGVVQPIVINKNPESGLVEVVAGRQRVKCAREANKRLIAQGCEPHQVPAVVRRGEGSDLAGVMVSENEIRTADSPLGRAKKMAHLITFGKTEDDLSVIFGCSAATVKSTLALLDCTAAVKNAVEAGQIGVGHAQVLAKLDPAEQRTKVTELIAAGDGAKPHEKAKRQRAVIDGEKASHPSRKVIKDRLGSSEGEFARALRWVLTGAEA